MPPVRWKLRCFVMAILVLQAVAVQQMQDAMSMSANGWRPIIGTKRNPPAEVTQYQHPNGLEVIPAQVVQVETTTSFLPSTQKLRSTTLNQPKFKSTMPYYVPQQTSVVPNKKMKKPVQIKQRKRGQVLAHSNRKEVYVQSPSANNGGYQFVKPNIKTREAQGFGISGQNYPQNPHIELTSFPLAGENMLKRPTYFIAKPQNDQYRVLPQRARIQQKGKGDTKISLYAFKEAVDSTSNIQIGQRAPPQFMPSQYVQNKNQQEQAVDVQVTRENVKQLNSGVSVAPASFGVIPGRNSFPIGYVDYNFQRPQQYQQQFQQLQQPKGPNTLTYEVTEGKFLDTPQQQFHFLPQDNFFRFQNLRQQPQQQQVQQNARPGLFVSQSTPSPPIFQSPLVDLSVPAFLPTPYKPETGDATPTSPSQSEAANVFTQVSQKMNHFRNQELQNNPLFFDIKDVSTHYPILTDIETTQPEISNEIPTTQRQRTRRPTKEPATTTTRDPTRSRITQRRRRPTTTTPTPVDTFEPIRSIENIEEAPVPQQPEPTEAETPPSTTAHRRRRPRPPVEEDSSRQRGKYRFRNRERSTQATMQRKRLRPYSENSIRDPSNSYESYEYSMEQSEETGTETSNVIDTTPDNLFMEEIHPTTTTTTTTTTEPPTITPEPSTVFHIPENEVDYTTPSIPEVTTTTEEPSTTVKSTRIRRPTKYDSSNRPRFSVKEYRQRLNQYSSTTPSSTTMAQSRTTQDLRSRFSSRRTRPTLTPELPEAEDEETTVRSRFRPKDPRHQATTENDNIITEKSVKSINTRLRPFARGKTTTSTEPPSTRVSIRPNLFSARRRTGYPSLKSRIQTKKEEEITTISEVEPLNVAESVTTEVSSTTDGADEDVTDDVVYSQRVSDLTSSFKDYDKPGVFNSVGPTSRSIPNYFTISTDDPILPIEAFFPNLKDKQQR